MNVPLRGIRFEVQGLVQASARNQSQDAFHPHLSAREWELLGSYLQPFAVQPRQVLIEQSASDRTVYFVETGKLTVHYEDDKGRLRLASVNAGSAVGEGAFFSRRPRNATVQAAESCKLWSLTPIRFTELAHRQPQLALEVAMGLAALVSRRLALGPRRVAVT